MFRNDKRITNETSFKVYFIYLYHFSFYDMVDCKHLSNYCYSKLMIYRHIIIFIVYDVYIRICIDKKKKIEKLILKVPDEM